MEHKWKSILICISLAIACSGVQADTVTFNYTGAAQSWTVPAGVTSIIVDAYGAQGGSDNEYGNYHSGGLGGRASSTLAVTPGETLSVYVGGQSSTSGAGYNGGGYSAGRGGGGGATDIQRNSTKLIVAGGGGGSGAYDVGSGDDGGAGGGLVGGDGFYGSAYDALRCGAGGTQTAGGAGATTGPGGAGSLGQGGTGYNIGGGGGGGYYGGGGGGHTTSGVFPHYGGGGGGSSYLTGTNASTTAGVRSGDGLLTITYAPPTAPSNPGASAIGTNTITWTWTDNSADETGFKVYDDPGAGPPATLRTTAAANVTSWQHNSLSANNLYAFQVAAVNGIGDSAKTSNYVAWTSIEPCTSVDFGSVGASSIVVGSTSIFSNLTAGSSGLQFTNVTTSTSSGWQQATVPPWTSSGLTPNTQYAFTSQSRNGEAVTTPAATAAKYTLAEPPSIGNNVTCDKSPNTVYAGATTFTFSNPAGFGAGTHGGSVYKATKFKYVWDTSTTYTFTGSETDWNTGTVARTQKSTSSYYLHLRSYNGDGVAGGTLDYGPFITDNTGLGPESDANNVYWDDQFQSWGATDSVYAMARYGSTVYVGGVFTAVAGTPANYVAKWDGTTWSAVGTGMNNTVRALAVDTSGNLYAGGDFTTAGGVAANYVAKWNGSAWSALGSGVGNIVGALGVNSSGVLYVGGWFTTAGGATANRVAKWDGTTWSALGVGTTGEVRALRLDSSGNVYFGGLFNQAGGITVNNIAKWNAGTSTWSALGSGTNADIYALALDSSSNVYASGNFTTAGGSAANLVAKWNGSAWSAMSSGMNGGVISLAVDGSNNVYGGGLFTTAGGTAVSNIAKWNGSAWSALGGGVSGGSSPYVETMLFDASGNLLAGGDFTKAGGSAASYLAKWTVASSTWSPLANTGLGVGGNVETVVSDGNGNFYAGGYFTTVGNTAANYVAKWNGTAWSALGTGTDTVVLGLQPDTSGNVYAVGDFTTAGGVTVNHVAKWNGSAWSALGTGTNGTTWGIAMDPSGNLYIGGAGSVTGGVTTNYIAKWNGSAWSALGTGMNGYVYALATDQSGNLYAGGAFTTAGGVTVNHVAKWNGSAWSALGTGTGGSYPNVYALAADDQGNLYAGGDFSTVGGVAADHVAKWNGTAWASLGALMNSTVNTLAFDAAGSLYAGGEFTTVAGSTIYRIAKWDGSAWGKFGSGVDGAVTKLAFDRNTLFAGGHFGTAGGKASGHFGIWQPRVNRSSASFAASPGAVTLGNDIYGFYKPTLATDASTAVTYSGGLPVSISIERAREIQVGGKRVNGAFTLGPEGVQFGGSGATLRIEFSEDDAALYGAAYTDFRVVKLTYPADYPTTKEAASLASLGATTPVSIRVENGRQIYALTVPFTEIGSTYGAVPQTYLPVSAPSNPEAIATIDSISWSWQDNSDNELGFRVYEDPGISDPGTLQTTTAADVTSWQHIGLAPNMPFAFQVCAMNSGGVSDKTATISSWTLAATPAAPVASSPGVHSLDVAVAPGDGNPAYTIYALRLSPDVGGNAWVQADGSLGHCEYYQTAAAWGVTTVTGLAEYTVYAFTAQARNGGSVDTAASPVSAARTLDGTPPTGTISINGGAAYANSTTVTLALSADDGGSGVTHMRFSNDNATWSGWETNALAESWELSSGDGLKTVYVQYRDAAGNVSDDVISAHITLDTMAPTAVITLVTPSPSGANTIQYTITFSEPVTQFDALSISPAGTLNGTAHVSGGPTDYALDIALSDADADGAYAFSIGNAPLDLAGNHYAGGTSPVCTIANWHGMLSQPISARLYTGDSYTLRVVPDCLGGGAIAYQWKCDDGSKTIHLGSETPAWTFTATLSSRGTYWCHMSYDGHTYDSDSANIQVADHLRITQQPRGGAIAAEQEYSVAVAADGGFPPLAYQWKKDGALIIDATGATYTITAASAENVGEYTVDVMDANTDSLTSEAATLAISSALPAAGYVALSLMALSIAAAAVTASALGRKTEHKRNS